jgi:hypothetical protein
LKVKIKAKLKPTMPQVYKPPFPLRTPVSDEDCREAVDKVYSLFNCKPPIHLPIYYEKTGLQFWEKGKTWVHKESKEVFIQLHPSCQKNTEKRMEYLSHEFVHCIRAPLASTQFEEILAYQTSNSIFRRFFAPILQSPKESIIFLGALFISLLFQILSLYTLSYFVYFLSLFLPIALISFFTLRLFFLQSVFKKAMKRLEKELKDHESPLSILIFCSDQEIFELNKLSKKELIRFIENKKSLNWIKER